MAFLWHSRVVMLLLSLFSAQPFAMAWAEIEATITNPPLLAMWFDSSAIGLTIAVYAITTADFSRSPKWNIMQQYTVSSVVQLRCYSIDFIQSL